MLQAAEREVVENEKRSFKSKGLIRTFSDKERRRLPLSGPHGEYEKIC